MGVRRRLAAASFPVWLKALVSSISFNSRSVQEAEVWSQKPHLFTCIKVQAPLGLSNRPKFGVTRIEVDRYGRRRFVIQ